MLVKWNPSNKFKPYINRSLNIEYINDNFSKEAIKSAVFEKWSIAIDGRKKLSTIVDEFYDAL